MLEPIQGEAGVFCATDTFLRELRELTARRGLLLILDEVQTGMGRTGRLFGYQHAGIEPDIMTLGKGIGAGVPLAALLAKEMACCFEHGDQGGTYNGNPLMCAAGLAVLEEVSSPAFLAGVSNMGAYFADRLERLSAERRLGQVRGRGLLLALDLGQPIGNDVVQMARDAGLLINSPRPDSLRFMPALNVTREEVDRMIAVLDAVLGSRGLTA
jgi:acetylornithine/N-succinyldiaminopimelate aminotransferase